MFISPSFKVQDAIDDSPGFRRGDSITNVLGMFRRISVLSLCLVALLVYYFSAIRGHVLYQLIVLLSVTIVYLAQVVQGHKNTVCSKSVLFLELLLYTIAWCAFLYFSGGIDNPLIIILLPYLAIGASILPATQAWIYGILIISSYWLLLTHHEGRHVDGIYGINDPHLFNLSHAFTVAAIVIVYYLSRTTKKLSKSSSDLTRAREDALRDKWILLVGGHAASTAHELSTPISTLSTLVEELKEMPEPAAISRANLELMESQLDVCKKALHRLTKKADIPYGENAKCYTADVWLRRIRDACQVLHPASEINIVLASQLSKYYLLPDITLEQALCNLVDNAIAVHPEKVKIVACNAEKKLRISIIDYGPGIQKEILLNLERGLPQASERGLGLGLILAKSAIERNGGRVEFISMPQGGTEVCVMLPFLEIVRS